MGQANQLLYDVSRCQTAADIVSKVASLGSEFYTRLLTRSAISEKAVADCRLRAVYDVSCPSVLELATTSIPMTKRINNGAPAMLTMADPLTHAPSFYHLMNRCLAVGGIDVLKCDHQYMRFWTSLGCLAEPIRTRTLLHCLTSRKLFSTSLCCSRISMCYQTEARFGESFDTFHQERHWCNSWKVGPRYTVS